MIRPRCWAALLAAAWLPAATVSPLDAPPVRDQALTWGEDRVVVGSTSLTLADLDWIETGGPATAPGSGHLGLWLTDGSWLPATAIAAAGSGDRLLATTPFGALELPLTAISAWGASETAAAANGLDRVVVASGPLDGRVQGLRGGSLVITTNLDPEPLTIALSDISAARLAQPATARPAGVHLVVTTANDRPPLRLLPSAKGPLLAVTAAPVTGLDGLRCTIDGGRRVWLSSLDPTTVDEKGAFGTVWPWQRDHGLYGEPLVLGGVRSARGVAVHSAATLGWTLEGRFQRLRARLGIADAMAPEGDCTATLRGDDRVLWSSAHVRSGDEPVILDLDLDGVTRLTLEVGLGDRYDIGDHLLLADAYLVTRR